MDEGIEEDKLAAIDKTTLSKLETAYKESKETNFQSESWECKAWEEIKDTFKYGQAKYTGVDLNDLREIGLKITTLPADEKFHP